MPQPSPQLSENRTIDGQLRVTALYLQPLISSNCQDVKMGDSCDNGDNEQTHLPKGKSHVAHFIHKLTNVGLGARCAVCASYIGPHFAGPRSLRHSVLKTTNSSSLPWTCLSQERREKDIQDEFNAPVLLAKKLRTKERSPGVRSTLFCHARRHTNWTKRADKKSIL